MAASWRQAIAKNVREIRLHLCQSSPSSKGAREFVEKHYVDLKQKNPTFPFLIRECGGIQSRLYARYDFGKEQSIVLDNLSSEEILQELKTLVLNESKT